MPHVLHDYTSYLAHRIISLLTPPSQCRHWFKRSKELTFKETAADIISRNGDRAPGFQSMRLMLACAVLFWHCRVICDGPIYILSRTTSFWRPLFLFPDAMFFCLGGFLVTASALRLRSLKTYLIFRALRIFPALAVEVTLCAVCLGGLLTTQPLLSYYHDPAFFRYFGSLYGNVTFWLPGVFQDHPIKIVNVSLWTLKPELLAYLFPIAIVLSKVIYDIPKCLYTVLIASLALLYYSSDVFSLRYASCMVVFCFFQGALACALAAYIPIHRYFFIVSALLAYLFMLFDTTIALGAVFVTYCTIYLGMKRLPLSWITRTGDYSYGIYLYGFPLQQALWHFLPFTRDWWMMLLVSLPASLIFAIISWHCIEKHALALKTVFVSRQ